MIMKPRYRYGVLLLVYFAGCTGMDHWSYAHDGLLGSHSWLKSMTLAATMILGSFMGVTVLIGSSLWASGDLDKLIALRKRKKP